MKSYLKYAITLLLTVLICSIIVVLSGCGTISVDLYTTVEPSGGLNQEIEIEGTGMVGNLVVSPDTIQDFKKEGWKVSTSRTGDSAFLNASKVFSQGAEIDIPGFAEEGQETGLKNINSSISDRIFFKEYYFEATIPGNLFNIDENDEFAEFGKAMLSAMFSMSWTLDLPGEIIETNADTYDKDTATWYFDIESLERDRKITIKTKYTNWTSIYIAIGVLVVIVGIITFFIIKRKQSPN